MIIASANGVFYSLNIHGHGEIGEEGACGGGCLQSVFYL
jgi:hypothetical protein